MQSPCCAKTGTDQVTRLSKATTETSLDIVASLLLALSLVAARANFYPEREPADKFMERFGGEKFDPKRRGKGSNCDGESERA